MKERDLMNPTEDGDPDAAGRATSAQTEYGMAVVTATSGARYCTRYATGSTSGCECVATGIGPFDCRFEKALGDTKTKRPSTVKINARRANDQHDGLGVHQIQRVKQRGQSVGVQQLVSRARLSFPRPDALAVIRGQLLKSGAGLGSIKGLRGGLEDMG